MLKPVLLAASFMLSLFGSTVSLGAVYFSRTSGNWNDASTWSVIGYTGVAGLTTPGSLPGDVVMISGHTVTVTATPANTIASIIISQNNNSGNDTRLLLSTAGVTLTCSALSVTDNNRNNNVDVEIADGVMQVNGSISITRTSSNSQDDRVRLYIYGNGRLNATGSLNYTLHRAANNNSGGNEIELSGQGRLDVGGNVNLICGNTNGGNSVLDVIINDTAQFNVTGGLNLTVSNSDDSDDIILDLNGGSMNVTGTMTATTASSATNNNCIFMLADGGTHAFGSILYNQEGGSGGDIEMKLNSASSLSATVINVAGDLTFQHSGGDNMELETNDNSILDVTGSIAFNLIASADGDIFYVDLNGGIVNAGNFYTDISSGATNGNSMLMNFDNSVFNISGDFVVNQAGGTTGDVNMIFNLTGTLPCSVNVGGDFIFNHTEGDNYEIELNANSVFTILGNFTDTLLSSDGDDFYIDIRGGILDIAGDFSHYSSTVTGTAEDLIVRVDDAGEFRIGGNADIYNGGGGQVSLYLNYNTGSNARFSVGGDMSVVNDPLGDGFYIDTDDSSFFTVTGDLNLTNHPAGGDIARFRIRSASTVSIGGDFNMLLDSGVTGVNDNIILDMDGGVLSVGGDLEIAASAGNASSFTMDGTSVATVTGELRLFHTGGNTSYIYLGNSSGSPVLTAGSLTLRDNGGAQTRCRLWNSSVLSITGDIWFDTDSAAQVDVALYANSKLSLGGNFIRNASRYGVVSCASTASIEFSGTAPQTLPGNSGAGGDAFALGSMIFNNPAGFFTSPTEGNVTIAANSQVTFVSGVVYTSEPALLILSSGTTVTGASDASHVDGPVRKVGSQSFVFPVGDNGNYQPAAISAPSNAAHHFTVQYVAEDPATISDDASLDASVDHVSGCEYWYVNRTNGTSNVTVTLAWDGGSCGVDDLAALRVVRWDGSAWRDHGNGGTTGTVSSGTIVNSAGITSYLSPNSPFTLASINPNNPLPVELIHFSAVAQDRSVNLSWSTASETDNDYFTVERAGADMQFITLQKVDGAGNSSTIQHYSCVDSAPINGVSYYRLKQTDINGTFSYSQVKAVNISASNLYVFPNPVTGNEIRVSSDISGFSEAMLINAGGKLIHCHHTTVDQDGSGIIYLPSGLPNGVYFLRIDGNMPVSQRILIDRK